MRARSRSAASRARAENLFGSHDRLLRFLRLHAGGRGAGLFDQALALGIGLAQHVLPFGFDPGQLGLDLLGVGQPAGDLLPARLEDPQDRLVGEQVQDGAHDPEADDLRDEMRPVDPERAGDLTDLSAALGGDLKREQTCMMNSFRRSRCRRRTASGWLAYPTRNIA